MKLYTTDEKKEKQFLRKKTRMVDLSIDRQEKDNLIKTMLAVMHEANGIGLSANQVGLPLKLFVAEVPSGKGTKRYAVFNPRIEKASEEQSAFEEGCLSIPGVYGTVQRPSRVTLLGQDKNGKPIKIKAWGLLARVFQHEIDHLDGVLFTDRVRKQGNA